MKMAEREGFEPRFGAFPLDYISMISSVLQTEPAFTDADFLPENRFNFGGFRAESQGVAEKFMEERKTGNRLA